MAGSPVSEGLPHRQSQSSLRLVPFCILIWSLFNPLSAYRMSHHRTYGPILPNVLSPVLLVFEELGKWVSADNPFPRFENLPQGNPVPEVWKMQQISLDQSPDPSSVTTQVASGIVHQSGNSANTCVCVCGGDMMRHPLFLVLAESGAEDKESAAAPWLESQQPPGPL